MRNDPYAPPRAVVEDVDADSRRASPWQVTHAVRLAWLSLLFEVPGLYDESLFQSAPEYDDPVLLAIGLGAIALIFALFVVVVLSMARGYRWARIVYSALVLIGLLGMISSVPGEFARAWYFGVLEIIVNLLGVATVCLLFTMPANAWFRTRGGQIEPP